ncbi:MAG: PA14 domain-containing protein [Pyrinomonadaceae bacterium]
MLASGAFTWQVDFHHDTHSHPFVAPVTGKKSGSFVIPTSGETAANVWYRIRLTVRDSAGLTHSVDRDVFPQKADVVLATSPVGLQVTLDGQPQTAPITFTGVVGVIRSLGVISPQTVNGVTYVFDSWSDGGAATHSISTPATNATYTAVFRVNAGRVGNGDGLTATYYGNLNLTGATFTRIDPTVNFEWRSGPAAGIGADTFSARWVGRVQPQFSETYTFYTRSDDGVRLWVNGQLLINNWTDHSQTENSGRIALVAGQKYDVRMEYYDNTRTGIAKLLWSSSSTPQAIIPRSQLYATVSPPAPWLARDIGSVTLAGDAGYANGTFTIKGSGADIWGKRRRLPPRLPADERRW